MTYFQIKHSQRVQREADDLQREAERSELSLDELTTLRQLEAKLGHALGQTEGPMIPEVSEERVRANRTFVNKGRTNAANSSKFRGPTNGRKLFLRSSNSQ